MKRVLTSSVFVGAALSCGPMMASAAVVYDPNTGHAIGIADFDYGLLAFDVHFRSGSFNDVYGLGAPLFIGLEASAEVARSLMRDILNAEAEVPVISDGTSEILWIPTASTVSFFQAEQLVHASVDAPWGISGDFSGLRNTDHSAAPSSWLFATFEDTGTLFAPPLEAPPSVPLPASVFLLLGGLGGLIGFARKRA